MVFALVSGSANHLIMANPLIAVKSLSMRLGHTTVIDKASLTIDRGELVGLIGRNASEKAAFINLIAGQCFPSSGEIIFHSEDITHLPADMRQLRGMVRTFQAGILFPDLTAIENVLLGSSIRPRPFFPRLRGAAYTEEAMTFLDFAGVPDIANELAGSLSPTQQSLLVIAVALASKPSLLILDEPAMATGVDVARLAEFLKRIRGEGIATLVSGQKGCLIMNSCDRVVALRKRGLIGAAASPQPAQTTATADVPRYWV